MMNLHNVVRGCIPVVNADQAFTYYKALGTFTRSYDTMTNIPDVAAGVSVKGQLQSIKPDDIIHAEKIEYGAVVRRIYLYADADPADHQHGIYRPLAYAGDYLTDAWSRQWKIDAVLEDFSNEGWVSVQAILQQVPQTLNIEDEEDDSE